MPVPKLQMLQIYFPNSSMFPPQTAPKYCSLDFGASSRGKPLHSSPSISFGATLRVWNVSHYGTSFLSPSVRHVQTTVVPQPPSLHSSEQVPPRFREGGCVGGGFPPSPSIRWASSARVRLCSSPSDCAVSVPCSLSTTICPHPSLPRSSEGSDGSIWCPTSYMQAGGLAPGLRPGFLRKALRFWNLR